MTPIDVVNKLIDAWVAQDWQAATDIFAADGCLELVPTRQKFIGHADIRSHLDEMAGGIETLEFVTTTLVAADNIVTFERIDKFVYNGKPAQVPCVGVFEIAGDKVKHWREYFDGFTMGKAVGRI
ncbi:MAG: limonene-1,2-epoxide hydrolase family protein [Pseudomonadota bacterium]